MSYYLQREREIQDQYTGMLGDSRRCPKHGEIISSADGLHDAPCCRCEYEMDQMFFEEEERLEEEALQELTISLDPQPNYDMVSTCQD